MSPFLELIKPLNGVIAYAIPTAIMGILLSRQYLRDRKPVTRRRVANAAWTILISGCWILFGNAVFDGYQRGMMSLPAHLIAQAVIFAFVAASFHLVERRYRQEAQS